MTMGLIVFRINLLRKTILAAALLVGAAGAAQGSPFIWAPEDSLPGWSTSYPYQRNIKWGFASNPTGGQTSSGAPGALYEGILDAVLWDSDFVTLDGVSWWDSIELGGTIYDGVIGIDNTSGSSDLAGWATFHIDNTETPWTKHGWLEYDVFSSLDGTLGSDVVAPAGYERTFTPAFDFILGDQLLDAHWGLGWTIVPNPPWEEIRLTFHAEPGHYVFIDNVHVATECVPEPATLALLGCGLLAVGGAMWRRRQKG